VREAAELRARTKTPTMRAPPTRPALRENLLLMAKQDQEAPKIHTSGNTHQSVVDLSNS
jgi:hypothetical protein